MPQNAKAGGITAAVLAAIAVASPLTRGFEGYVHKPAPDPVGIQTVCYGETHVVMKAYSRADCEKFLYQHQTVSYAPYLLGVVPGFVSKPHWNAFGASMDFLHNVGHFAGTSMERDFNAGRWKQGCADFIKYRFAHNHGKLVVLKGLERRRTAERNICLKGLS